ncbi:hypothetical protein QJS66_06460 [Kocuria rhizophila]|nr:hypothetical protein QJS66_06460 [Kocuria rhizophila]
MGGVDRNTRRSMTALHHAEARSPGHRSARPVQHPSRCRPSAGRRRRGRAPISDRDDALDPPRQTAADRTARGHRSRSAARGGRGVPAAAHRQRLHGPRRSAP